MEKISHKGFWYNIIVSEEGIVRVGLTYSQARWLYELDVRNMKGYNIQKHQDFVQEGIEMAKQAIKRQ